MLRRLRFRSWNFETNLLGRNRTDVNSISAQSLALWRLDDGRSMLVSRLHNRWFPLVRAFVSDHDRLPWHNRTQWCSACTLVIVGLLLFLLRSEVFEMVSFTGVSRATTWEVVLKLSSE